MRTRTSRLASTTAWIIIGAIGIVLLLLAITILISQRPTDCGTDKECFIRIALPCGSARLTIIDDRGTAELSARRCIVTKTVTSLDNAVLELNHAIAGRSMTCPYQNGFFPPELLESITSGTEICEGELKEQLVTLASLA